MTTDEAADTDLDETDVELLRRIERDFDVSLDTLADELPLSRSAVHYRIKKLKRNGVIQGVTADLDPLAFGLDTVAITDVSVTHEEGYSEEIGTQLAAIGGIEQVYYTMGDVDFTVLIRVRNRDRMNEVINRIVAIEAVTGTASRFVMDEVKSNPKVLTGDADGADLA
jgi:DNA-binding Lrp family transcriptional regulator